MKLAKITIENFRHFGTSARPLEISFTDPLDRVREFTLLIGPNTIGKTTILDAIAASLGPGLGMPTLRSDFKMSPRTVVCRGALHAKVTCWLRFSPEEITVTRDIFKLAQMEEKVPDIAEVKVTWIYPDPRKPFVTITTTKLPSFFNEKLPPSPFGFSQYEPAVLNLLFLPILYRHLTVEEEPMSITHRV